jgi:hypothetical protein
MKRIVHKEEKDKPECVQGIDLLIKTANNAGYELSANSAYLIWAEYQDFLCATCVEIDPDRNDLLTVLLEFGQVEEDGN